MSGQFWDEWMKPTRCRYRDDRTPCWGELRSFVHYAGDDSIDDEWDACEGHQDMHLTGIYVVEPDYDWDTGGQTLLDLSKITLTQEQFDALISVLAAIDSDETRRAVDGLRKIWEIYQRNIDGTVR